MREADLGRENPVDFVQWFGWRQEGVVTQLPKTFSIERIYPIPRNMQKYLSSQKREVLNIGIGQLRVVGQRIVIERTTTKPHIGVVVVVFEKPRSDLEAAKTMHRILPQFEDMTWKGAIAREDESGYIGSLIALGEDPFLILKDSFSAKGAYPGLHKRAYERVREFFHRAPSQGITDLREAIYFQLANHLEASLKLYAQFYGFAAYRRARGGLETHLRRIV